MSANLPTSFLNVNINCDGLDQIKELRAAGGAKGHILYCHDENNFSYVLLPEEKTAKPYSFLNREIEKNQAARKAPQNVAKILLRERITGRSIFDSNESSPDAFPYVQYNAQTLGEMQNDDNARDFRYVENLSNQCGKSVVWLHGERSGNMYLKKIHCKKQWCPECGGKGGRIHKARLHGIMKRVDLEKYIIRQFVLTIPAELREFFKSAANLSKLEKAAKETAEKFFGEPAFDKRGHVKRRQLKKGVIAYLHLFGDKEPGVFKPHMNMHIFEQKGEKMKLEKPFLDAIKAYWLKKLKAISGQEDLSAIDVHYSFRMSAKKNMHSIKYMSRPWSTDDYAAIKDDDLKRLLVVDMKGFSYMRFWGSLANCKYKDEMSLPEIKHEVESVVKEPLKMLFVAPFDEARWLPRLDLMGEGLYKIKLEYSREALQNYRECMDFFNGKSGFDC